MKLLETKDDGFTFIETIISMAIILILTLAVGFSAVKYMDNARITKVRKEMDSFKKGLEAYYMDTGVFPTKAQGLNSLWEKPYFYPVPKNWSGPYIDSKVPSDPWGNDYIYNIPGYNNLPYEIISLGADGEEGGEGSGKDIISWDR